MVVTQGDGRDLGVHVQKHIPININQVVAIGFVIVCKLVLFITLANDTQFSSSPTTSGIA